MSKPSIPDTIPCDQQFICPATGGATRCEPRLDGVNEALGYATYRHQCAYGWEAVDLLDLFPGDRALRDGELADFRRACEAYARAVEDAMLADAAASAVARDEVFGEIVEEEERWS